MRRAFSTAESLTVIAIIMVLIGLSLPVFLRAKHRATGGACKDKLRKIYQALLVYSSDHGGNGISVLPPGIWALPLPRNEKVCKSDGFDSEFAGMWVDPKWGAYRQGKSSYVLVADEKPHLSQGGGIALFSDGSIVQKSRPGYPASLEYWK